MARTHGTRSSYNAGCRCDACREAARLARARQREASRYGTRSAVAPFDGSDAAWKVAVASLCGGGLALWKGVTLPREEVEEDAFRRTRHRRILAGIGLVGFGLFVFSRMGRTEGRANAD